MIKLTSFGISIQGSVNTYGDNNAMVKDTNILESTLDTETFTKLLHTNQVSIVAFSQGSLEC